ncbi:hypothetical protein JQX13_17580 [Archangium violaceum]|uniref:hypothetical protein n=1 Tax=Archangium violaceum TaxID=83451 RepID=UPI00193BBE7B|nr:hypothetical protein [Archangium violaceum]QRK11718.1 hypothetical protein JQX13_17580 [Archangium violaceum]
MHRGWKLAAMAAVLGVAGTAQAHEFRCEKRIQVKGESQVPGSAPRVTKFPATLRFHYKLRNVHPTSESVAQHVEDPLLAPYGFSAPFSTPMAVEVFGARDAFFELKLDTPEACHALAASDGRVDENFDSAFRVKWSLGETQCAARVTCCEPFVDCEMACPPDDPDCVEPAPVKPDPSRNAGFFKVHEQALQQCLGAGPLELGVARVASLEQALGLLWASPGLDRKGGVRSEEDSRRFELAREALVSTCNERLFGASEKRGRALDEALRALRGGSGDEGLERLATELRRHNEAGSREPLPGGFDAGRATPAHAASIAADPMEPGRP